MPARAITFDFWCTLFRDPKPKSSIRQRLRLEAFVRATGAPPDEVAAAMEQTAAEFARHHIEEQRTLDPLDAVRLTATTLGITIAPATAAKLAERFAKAILEHPPEPIDGALDAVRAAAQIAPLGIVSDSGISPGTSLRQLLARHGFLEYFAAFAFSDEVGVAKPQARMFETVAAGLGVRPGELLHIGDLEPTDIKGAKDIGAKAVLFAGDNPKYFDSTRADHKFTSWQGFVEALPEFG